MNTSMIIAVDLATAAISPCDRRHVLTVSVRAQGEDTSVRRVPVARSERLALGHDVASLAVAVNMVTVFGRMHSCPDQFGYSDQFEAVIRVRRSGLVV